MMNFKKYLNEGEWDNFKYVDPNTLYDLAPNKSYGFVYVPRTDRLFGDYGCPGTHHELGGKYKRQIYDDPDISLLRASNRTEVMKAGGVCGRIATISGKYVVSFWDRAGSDVTQAIKALLRDNLISGDTIAVVPGIAMPVSQVMSHGFQGEGGAWSKELLDKVHLLPPQLKKQILGNVGGTEKPTTAAWKDLYQGDPKHLYSPWRATSEATNYGTGELVIWNSRTGPTEAEFRGKLMGMDGYEATIIVRPKSGESSAPFQITVPIDQIKKKELG